MTKQNKKYTVCPYCGGRYQFTEDQLDGVCDYCEEFVKKGKWGVEEVRKEQNNMEKTDENKKWEKQK